MNCLFHFDDLSRHVDALQSMCLRWSLTELCFLHLGISYLEEMAWGVLRGPILYHWDTSPRSSESVCIGTAFLTLCKTPSRAATLIFLCERKRYEFYSFHKFLLIVAKRYLSVQSSISQKARVFGFRVVRSAFCAQCLTFAPSRVMEATCIWEYMWLKMASTSLFVLNTLRTG